MDFLNRNALNVVKDDLIVQVDQLTGEQEILREEVNNLSAAREQLRERVTQLEDELRHLKVLFVIYLLLFRKNYKYIEMNV